MLDNSLKVRIRMIRDTLRSFLTFVTEYVKSRGKETKKSHKVFLSTFNICSRVKAQSFADLHERPEVR